MYVLMKDTNKQRTVLLRKREGREREGREIEGREREGR